MVAYKTFAVIIQNSMNLEDEFLTIRRVDKDPYPPTKPLQQIPNTVSAVMRHVAETGCIILQEYYVLQDDGTVMLFFGWRDMEMVESFVCTLEGARRICEKSFGRR